MVLRVHCLSRQKYINPRIIGSKSERLQSIHLVRKGYYNHMKHSHKIGTLLWPSLTRKPGYYVSLDQGIRPQLTFPIYPSTKVTRTRVSSSTAGSIRPSRCPTTIIYQSHQGSAHQPGPPSNTYQGIQSDPQPLSKHHHATTPEP